jgi:hypothetical protein
LTRSAAVWLIGLLVVPVCLQLLFGVPYAIVIDRDLQLQGRPVSGTVLSERMIQFKGGRWQRMAEVEYQVEGRSHRQEYALDRHAVGTRVALRYSPLAPRHAVLDVPPVRPWDEQLMLRLATTWTLGLVFSTAWVRQVLASRPRPVEDP